MAQDPEPLALAAAARAGQPVPDLLFAAVHLLLSSEQETGDPLARHYPGLVEPTASSTDAFPAFRRFCFAHAAAIVEIVSGRSEQQERASRLDHAIAIARAARHRLNFGMRQGGGAALLPTIAAELADSEALCVVHSFTLNQFSSEARLTLDRALHEIAAKRDALRLGLEWERRHAPVLSVTEYSSSGIERRDLARCDANGSGVKWLAVREY